MKRMFLFYDFDGFAQQLNLVNQQALVSLQQVNSKEIAAAGDTETAIIRHASSVVEIPGFGESHQRRITLRLSILHV